MRNILAKTDNVGDTLIASAFNANLRTELQALVTDTGQSLDPEAGPDTDQDMIGKALAHYSSDAGFYQDSGAADAYVLGRVGSLQPVPAYFDGQQIVFVAGNNNTGASTVNVTTIGSKDIRRVGGAVLSANDIVAGQYIVCRFDSGNDYFEFVGFVSAAGVGVAGIIALTTQTLQEAATDNASAVTPATQQFHPSAAKAWVNFNGTGVVAIRGQHNVSSITDNGAGDYTVNYTTAFADVNYAYTGGYDGSTAASSYAVNVDPATYLAASTGILVTTGTGSEVDVSIVTFMAFGDQ